MYAVDLHHSSTPTSLQSAASKQGEATKGRMVHMCEHSRFVSHVLGAELLVVVVNGRHFCVDLLKKQERSTVEEEAHPPYQRGKTICNALTLSSCSNGVSSCASSIVFVVKTNSGSQSQQQQRGPSFLSIGVYPAKFPSNPPTPPETRREMSDEQGTH